jgi:DNA processing protein
MEAEMTNLPLKRGMDEQERLSLIGLSYVEFLSPREKHVVIQMAGSAARLYDFSLPDLAELVGRRLITRMWKPAEILRSARAAEKILTQSSIECIFYGESGYPKPLSEIYDPPLVLFRRGSLPEHDLSLAGVVGTRYPTGAARAAAFRLGFELGRKGVGVVSGLARGIDREAHMGCVEAGGYSVAVLGNGIDIVYPTSSQRAAVALLQKGGAILSEYPPGIPPLQYHFPARNRIISGLCRSVVVVQAPERSGALITAEYALDQGRDLFVHALGLAGSAGRGTRRLAESGAPVIHEAADILRDWGVASGVRQAVSFPREMPEGRRLAEMDEKQIDGACAQKGGATYWRE